MNGYVGEWEAEWKERCGTEYRDTRLFCSVGMASYSMHADGYVHTYRRELCPMRKFQLRLLFKREVLRIFGVCVVGVVDGMAICLLYGQTYVQSRADTAPGPGKHTYIQ